MVRRFVVLLALASAMAFAQGRPGAGNTTPTTPSAKDSSPDVGTESRLQPKSIDQVLHDDTKLSAKLQAMLPANVTPQQACAGFMTLEQCVTAIHVAQNLKVPFADLKAKTTGKGSVSLQKAIEQMAANVNAKDEAKKAKKQAGEDMKGVNLFG
jgi:hypothetical protein